MQLESRRLAGTLPLHAFPLSCTSTALPTAQQQAIEALWSSLSPAETPVQSRGEGLPAAVNGATAPVGAAQPAARIAHALAPAQHCARASRAARPSLFLRFTCAE